MGAKIGIIFGFSKLLNIFFRLPHPLWQLCWLLQDVVEEGGEGDEDAGGGEPEGGGLADAGVAGLHLVGLYVDDVVLLEIVVGGVHQTGIVEIQGVDLLLAIGILADELHIVAHAIDGEVTGLRQGLEDVDLLIAHGEHTGTGDFTEDGDLVVGHADSDHRALVLIQVGTDLGQDELLTIGLGETAHRDGTDDGELYLAVVVDQIALDRRLGMGGTRILIEDCRYRQVEGDGRLWINCSDGDGEDVLGHNLCIVEIAGLLQVDILGVLEIGNIFRAAASYEEHGST